MDEELKLIKNEIKQVLLEIQEYVLDVQNPFTSVVVGNRIDNPTESAPAAAVAEPAAPKQEPPDPTPQAPQQQNPGFNPQFQGGFPGPQGPQGPQMAYQGYPQQNMGVPPPPAAPQPAVPPPAAPQDTTVERPRIDLSDLDRGSNTFVDRRIDIGDELLGDYDLGDIGDMGTEHEADWTDEEDQGTGFIHPDVDKDSGSDVDQDDEGDYGAEDEKENEDAYESEDDEPAPRRGRNKQRAVDEEPDDQDPTVDLDLVTLASLIQWTDRVVQQAGPEYLEALFEISEMTGRLSTELKNTLLVLVKLLSIEVSGSSIGATETVRLLAQLDGLMGNTTKEDARLLPFILEGNNLEVLSLIQR